MSSKPSILYVTTTFQFPPYAGSTQRAVNIARQLRRYSEVTMLAVSHHFDSDSVELYRKEFSRFLQVHLKAYSDYTKPWGELIRKIHMHWPSNCGIRANRADQELFEKLAAQHDIVWFHTLGAQNPFIRTPAEKSVMDLDDLNHCKYEQSAIFQPTLRFRLSAKVQSFKWRLLERCALKRFKTVVVCSDTDKAFLGDPDNVQVVPNGFNPPLITPQRGLSDSCRLGFIGLLSYGPNRDGLRWFRENVWPLILKKRPEMRLRIVGKLPAEKDYVEAEGFEYLGYIDDPTAEMQTWSAMIVPILYGGGTRIKIIEGFSKKCPVISTTIGAHGISAVNEKHLFLTDKPDEFSRRCLQLSAFPDVGKRLAEEGWGLFNEKYTWDAIGKSMGEILNYFR